MRLLPLLATLPALAACTAPDGTGDVAAAGTAQECFFSSQVDGFADAGPDKVLVRLGFRQAYELTLRPGCPNASYATAIGLVSRGGDRVCTGRPAQLLVPRASGTGAERCLVSDIRALPQAEWPETWQRRD
ncbi:DUF6491 family protein [Croceibacterium sp. TMG7-5b_MA50]|uniref:DUF6491 family protein n=1 Tax=Croceibacterium sp. TMG7-5b_MA50 TaxID=3121290 RepID=UPI0032218031